MIDLARLVSIEAKLADRALSDDEYDALDREWHKAMAEAEAGGRVTWRLDAIEATLADPNLPDEAYERWSMAWLAEMSAGVERVVAQAATMSDEERLSAADDLAGAAEVLRRLCGPGAA